MGQPASTPYRVERIKELNSPLKGGYVLKEASGIIVGAFPGGAAGPLSRCEGTARLAAAGANHLPALLERARRLEGVLRGLRHSEAAWREAEAAMAAAARALEGRDDDASRAAREGLLRAAAAGAAGEDPEAAALLTLFIDAADRARRDTPD